MILDIFKLNNDNRLESGEISELQLIKKFNLPKVQEKSAARIKNFMFSFRQVVN